MITQRSFGIVSRSWQRIRRKANFVGRVVAVLTLCAGFAAVGTGPAHAATGGQEPVPGRNGQVVALTRLHYPSYCANPNIRVYRMFYWSDGYELEAYVSEPKRPGKYPVVECLHGGWPFALPGCAWNVRNEGDGIVLDRQTLTSANWCSKIVTVVPYYRGYGRSLGKVGGLMTDTRDALNALKAVDSLHEANTHDVYLWGISLGGGVALMLASELQDVRAVVAVSPFVGFDILEYWEKRLHDPGFDDYQVACAQATCSATAFKAASPYDHVQAIHAPVLLLQGKQDHHVMWQTVESFYQRMKADHKTVKLVLYPHGHHGLTRAHWPDRMMQTAQWFRKYGLPGLWWSAYVAEKGITC